MSVYLKYIRYLKTFNKYTYLLKLLVKKEVKKKYKGSILGILWSLLNPLLYMIIITIVFSTLFKTTIENFPVYLLCGSLLFGFFSSSTTTAMLSIRSSADLFKKVYIPKYIVVISSIISNFIFFLISMIDLILIMIITKVEFTTNLLISPIYLMLLLLFSCGVGLILATFTVFFRDIEHIYSVFTMFLMYASAIFYPEDIIPQEYKLILTANPIYYFIKGFRSSLGLSSGVDLSNLVVCAILALISIIAGIIVFEKKQDKFILHI